MGALEKALVEIREVEHASRKVSCVHSLDPRVKTIVAILYIIAVLSVSLASLQGILLFWIFPIIGSAIAGVRYGELFRKSLYALPFILFIGVFNPVFDRTPVLYAGGVPISRGWVEFVSISLRGLLCVQAVLLLVMTTGFYHVCRGLGRMGVPVVFTTQLLLVYRYVYVLVDEAIDMDRARKSRSCGVKGYGFKMWGTFVGQLLIRTVERARRIQQAMLSRGFDGEIHLLKSEKWRGRDTLFLILCTGCFTAGRLLDVGSVIHLLK